jgi:hypothetical protein
MNNPSPVPTEPGSVVLATVTHNGKERRRTFMRHPVAVGYRPAESPWVAHQDVCDRAYFGDADLRDVEVLYDAGTHSGEEGV